MLFGRHVAYILESSFIKGKQKNVWKFVDQDDLQDDVHDVIFHYRYWFKKIEISKSEDFHFSDPWH